MAGQAQPEVLKVLGVVPAGQSRTPAEPRKPKTDAGSPKPASAVAPANEPVRLPNAEGRTTGLNYVVIESFAPDKRADAETARQFLARNRVSATIERSARGWVLVSTEGLQFRDPKLDALMTRIRTLGEQYLKQGGRYRFECFAKKYKGGSW